MLALLFTTICGFAQDVEVQVDTVCVQKDLIDVRDQGLSKDNLAISIQFTLVLAVSCKGTPRRIFSDLPSKR